MKQKFMGLAYTESPQSSATNKSKVIKLFTESPSSSLRRGHFASRSIDELKQIKKPTHLQLIKNLKEELGKHNALERKKYVSTNSKKR